MTKEELEKESEEYALKQWEGQIPWGVIQKSYYDGAEPREKQIQIDAEQIRALQKQNGELTDELTKKSDTNHQLVEQLAKLNERCFDLEKENAELKETVTKMNNVITETFRNLSKAKELLKKVLDLKKIVTKAEEYLLLEEAEQFLKDNA